MIQIMKNVKSEDKNQESQPLTGLRFKVTNLKKDAYPNPLEQTDYYGIKVGDTVCVGYSESTLYKVVKIERSAVATQILARWKQYIAPMPVGSGFEKNPQPTVIRDKKAYELLLEYEKNSNFGPNKLHLEVLIRGSKEPKRSKFTQVYEMDHVRHINYNILNKVDIPTIIQNCAASARYIDAKAQRVLDSKKKVVERQQTLEKILYKAHPELAPKPAPVEVTETQVSVEYEEIKELLPELKEAPDELVEKVLEYVKNE